MFSVNDIPKEEDKTQPNRSGGGECVFETAGLSEKETKEEPDQVENEVASVDVVEKTEIELTPTKSKETVLSNHSLLDEARGGCKEEYVLPDDEILQGAVGPEVRERFSETSIGSEIHVTNVGTDDKGRSPSDTEVRVFELNKADLQQLQFPFEKDLTVQEFLAAEELEKMSNVLALESESARPMQEDAVSEDVLEHQVEIKEETVAEDLPLHQVEIEEDAVPEDLSLHQVEIKEETASEDLPRPQEEIKELQPPIELEVERPPSSKSLSKVEEEDVIQKSCSRTSLLEAKVSSHSLKSLSHDSEPIEVLSDPPQPQSEIKEDELQTEPELERLPSSKSLSRIEQEDVIQKSSSKTSVLEAKVSSHSLKALGHESEPIEVLSDLPQPQSEIKEDPPIEVEAKRPSSSKSLSRLEQEDVIQKSSSRTSLLEAKISSHSLKKLEQDSEPIVLQSSVEKKPSISSITHEVNENLIEPEPFQYKPSASEVCVFQMTREDLLQPPDLPDNIVETVSKEEDSKSDKSGGYETVFEMAGLPSKETKEEPELVEAEVASAVIIEKTEAEVTSSKSKESILSNRLLPDKTNDGGVEEIDEMSNVIMEKEELNTEAPPSLEAESTPTPSLQEELAGVKELAETQSEIKEDQPPIDLELERPSSAKSLSRIEQEDALRKSSSKTSMLEAKISSHSLKSLDQNSEPIVEQPDLEKKPSVSSIEINEGLPETFEAEQSASEVCVFQMTREDLLQPPDLPVGIETTVLKEKDAIPPYNRSGGGEGVSESEVASLSDKEPENEEPGPDQAEIEVANVDIIEKTEIELAAKKSRESILSNHSLLDETRGGCIEEFVIPLDDSFEGVVGPEVYEKFSETSIGSDLQGTEENEVSVFELNQSDILQLQCPFEKDLTVQEFLEAEELEKLSKVIVEQEGPSADPTTSLELEFAQALLENAAVEDLSEIKEDQIPIEQEDVIQKSSSKTSVLETKVSSHSLKSLGRNSEPIIVLSDIERKPSDSSIIIEMNEDLTEPIEVEQSTSEVCIFQMTREDLMKLPPLPDRIEEAMHNIEEDELSKRLNYLVENMQPTDSVVSSLASKDSFHSLLQGTGSSSDEMDVASESFHYPSLETVDDNDNPMNKTFTLNPVLNLNHSVIPEEDEYLSEEQATMEPDGESPLPEADKDMKESKKEDSIETLLEFAKGRVAAESKSPIALDTEDEDYDSPINESSCEETWDSATKSFKFQGKEITPKVPKIQSPSTEIEPQTTDPESCSCGKFCIVM